jgi:pyruvate, orthophosphate dikinase
MDEKKGFSSSALQVNLERTAAQVEIPEKNRVLLAVADGHYGLLKRTTELLTELNHPFVNWDYVVKELKGLSIGDFYEFNRHPNGLQAAEVFLRIYLDSIGSEADESVRETAVRFLFEYIDTLVTKSGEFLTRNGALLPFVFEVLVEASSADPYLFRKSSTYGKKTLRYLVEYGIDPGQKGLCRLLHNLFKATYAFWLSLPDPAAWSGVEDEGGGQAAYRAVVEPLGHAYLRGVVEKLEEIADTTREGGTVPVNAYLDLVDYHLIAEAYLTIADELGKSTAYAGHQHLVKLNFLFRIIETAGLKDIHGLALREVSRCLDKVFEQESPERLSDFVRQVFVLLKKSASQSEYRSTIIDCVTTIGRETFKRKNHALADTLIDELIRFGFEQPELKGSTVEWQVLANPAHIKNIRAWLEIVGIKPRWTKRLLSALIINLKLGGVFVRDTDLLQRDISALLNAEIAPAYNLVKQLLRLFPIYFSEIGAEGELRDISTKADELSFRSDTLVHFLRKQSHVESNSLLVNFIEDAFRCWFSGTKEYVRPHLPAEVYEDVSMVGELYEGLHAIFKVLLSKTNGDAHLLLEWDKGTIAGRMRRIRKVTKRDKERAALLIRLYQLLHKKYNPQHVDLLKDLEVSHTFEQSKIKRLKRSLGKKEYHKSLGVILGFLSLLKEKILAPEKTDYFENIYHKRHIAAGIPSMYGTYREEKFEAVGLSLRLESLAATLFEELITSLNLKFITKSTLTKIHDCLWLYSRALDLEGIATEGLTAKMKYLTSALQVKQFSVDQYIDIFQFISKSIQDIIRDYYIDAHRSNLSIVINQILEKEPERMHEGETLGNEEPLYRLSEAFIRWLIPSAFGLQALDNLVNRIIGTLGAELERFRENKRILNLVMAYNPELTVTPIHKADKRMDNQILVGNKGYFLKQLASFNFPVPPGFIITTEVFKSLEAVVGYKYIFKDLSQRIRNEVAKLEKTAGRKFGDPGSPLLLSVRSGATISLPGMMRSFLNVGLNEAVAEGLSKREGFEWAAWDSYRRLLQMWGMYEGLDRNFFDRLIDKYKQRYSVARKIQFSPDQMRQVALTYKAAMKEQGIEVTDDPAKQLEHAVQQVFASWHSEQARIYRHQMRVSDDWGTAVIVQAMIFGNLNENSGSGVIFTRNPKGVSRNVTPYGDFIFGVQGDDIVSGLVTTYPVSEQQRLSERRDSSISLEANFPEIYSELVRLSEVLVYEKRFNHQEMEFTFENATRAGLYILQTREMVQAQARKLRIFKDTKELQASILGSGIGVSGGALWGKAVYGEKEIREFRSREAETPLILVRPDTVPDDVGVLLQVEGLLTAKGGSTSHAAVTIPQLNKVGVVGFSKLKVHETQGYSTVDGHIINAGDFISIDGWSGAVYFGRHEVEIKEGPMFSI